jgi:hypothetical protein
VSILLLRLGGGQSMVIYTSNLSTPEAEARESHSKTFHKKKKKAGGKIG